MDRVISRMPNKEDVASFMWSLYRGQWTPETYNALFIYYCNRMIELERSNISYPTVARDPDFNSCITFTITTCKRLALFMRTMDSFLLMCKDRHLISKWICVDDNSSEVDKTIMESRYPFMEFIWKTPEQKGHSTSMNMLLERIETDYFFHCEDDWQFVRPMEYMTVCKDVLDADATLGQCLLNRMYAETFRDCMPLNDVVRLTPEPLKTPYYVHNTNIESACSYWPQYSLRVGLNRTGTIKALLPYRNGEHFEREFADRYTASGFFTAYLPLIECVHIGRLTSERFDRVVPNAYDLNNQQQFVVHSFRYPVHVVNLDRRPDRMETFRKTHTAFSFNRFTAVDGNQLTPSAFIDRLFNDNDYHFRSALIGCALSHINLWKQLMDSPTDEGFIIMEDDITCVDNFVNKIETYLDMIPQQLDVLFIGHHAMDLHAMDPNAHDDDYLIEKYSAYRSISTSYGGTGGYIITKSGATRLYNHVMKHGISKGIDTEMQHLCNTFNIYYTGEQLFSAPCFLQSNIHENNGQSDIQGDYRSLYRTPEERIREDLAFYESNEYDVIIQAESVKVEPRGLRNIAVFYPRQSEGFLYENGINYNIGRDVSVHVWKPIFL
jgi:GR25 family glycosyltransferase involved in LPS biosynthesis